MLLTVINTILPLLYLHNYSAARSKSEPETISNQLIFFLPYKISFDYTLLYPAIRVRLSIFRDTSGTRKKTLPAASTFTDLPLIQRIGWVSPVSKCQTCFFNKTFSHDQSPRVINIFLKFTAAWQFSTVLIPMSIFYVCYRNLSARIL